MARAAGGPDDPGDDSTLAVTLAYAAPEMITGDTVDGRADIYSLACTLFRLLTGKQPFHSAEGTTALALAHLHQTPPQISDHLPEATRQLDVVMARALAKNPAERFDSARVRRGRRGGGELPHRRCRLFGISRRAGATRHHRSI